MQSMMLLFKTSGEKTENSIIGNNHLKELLQLIGLSLYLNIPNIKDSFEPSEGIL